MFMQVLLNTKIYGDMNKYEKINSERSYDDAVPHLKINVQVALFLKLFVAFVKLIEWRIRSDTVKALSGRDNFMVSFFHFQMVVMVKKDTVRFNNLLF